MFSRRDIVLPLILALILNGLTLTSPPAVQVAQAQAATVVYNLFATDGYIALADGTQLYNYGFVGGRVGAPLVFQASITGTGIITPGGVITIPAGPPTPTGGPITPDEAILAGNAQFPAPIIYATTDDVVEIHLKNLGVNANPTAPNDPHSIHLHGLDVNAANDGVPETSVGAVPANLTGVPGAGNVIVYMFSPSNPGTYMYHCHQEADIHVQMGMYGALVVYNPGDAAAAGGPGTGSGSLWDWDYDKDVVLLLSEIDTRQHESEQNNGNFNPVTYKPQYWAINGLSFPNTIHADGGSGFVWTDWIAAHPGYDPFIVGHVNSTSVAGTTGDKILLRVINMGFETQPMHMHGFHGKILGADQRPWTWAQPTPNTPAGTGLEKNTLTIGSGETYEWLLDFGVWHNQATSTYPADTQTRYTTGGIPVANTNTGQPVILNPDGVEYIGGPTVFGANGLPTPGQLFPFHNHDDYKATNNGTYPGGMFTMIETIP
jgi:FtsP/CotA-like multicopper oxidase with cupredoxin domain